MPTLSQRVLQAVEKGLVARPEHPQLLALRNQIKQRLDADQRQQQAAQALARAQELMQQEAWEESLQVVNTGLEIDPENTPLQQLKDTLDQRFKEQQRRNQLAQQYLDESQQLTEQGDLQQSQQILKAGLEELPDNTLLNTELERINQQIERARSADLEPSATIADNTNLNRIQQGLRGLPDDETLLTGLQNRLNAAEGELDDEQQQALVELILQQSQTLQQRGDLEQSLALVAQGLAIAPENSNLQALRGELLTQLDSAELNVSEGNELVDNGSLEIPPVDLTVLATEQQDRIQQLLATAAEHLQQKRLTSPRAGNAYLTYQQVLELDPENEAALAGIEDIANTYLLWARSNNSRGNLDKSLRYTDRGLSVAPTNSELIQLRAEVLTKQAEIQAAQAEVNQPTTTRPPPDPCDIDTSSRECWCKSFGMFCN